MLVVSVCQVEFVVPSKIISTALGNTLLQDPLVSRNSDVHLEISLQTPCVALLTYGSAQHGLHHIHGESPNGCRRLQ
jgi:hypothetical protein